MKKKNAPHFFQRDRILNSSRWICLVHVTRTSLLYLRDSHDQARVRLAIKVKVKSGNFQTHCRWIIPVYQISVTQRSERSSCLENTTFYDYRYINLSKKIDFFPLYPFIFFIPSFFFYFPIVSYLENVQIISRYLEENFKRIWTFLIHIIYIDIVHCIFVHYREFAPYVQTKASRDLSRILTINLELTLASPSINWKSLLHSVIIEVTDS